MDSDIHIYETLLARTDALVDYTSLAASLAALSVPCRIFWVAAALECEVTNGGLCQFFVNLGSPAAVYVGEALAQIGAAEHKALWDSFLRKHRINPADLSSFAIDPTVPGAYASQTKRYPFREDFDTPFFALPSLSGLLTDWATKQPEAFF